jgi:hypothetical protein
MNQSTSSSGRTAAARSISADEAAEIAIDTYIYAYPLLIMGVTRRVMTNIETADNVIGRAPINQFAHVPAFPDHTFTDVVRPNADTLYSLLFFDVSKEPLLIDVPDSGGRYYLLPMLDMWTDVFASPGKRTTGTDAQSFALLGPAWSGQLPKDVEPLRSPTNAGWIVGRTQTNGKADYENVHKFQSELIAKPLSARGKPYSPPKGKIDSSVSMTPPDRQVAGMNVQDFFSRFLELLKENPPHPNDYAIIHRAKRIGLEEGKSFDLSRTRPEIRAAIEAAPTEALKRITNVGSAGTAVNGWRLLLSPIGTYGTDYLRRALIAFGGLGANVLEDAIYPTAFTDSSGRPFDSGNDYVIHFENDQIPPVRAFWSLTMYNDKQLFPENPISRYAIGDRDPLKFNGNGSLDLYIQRDSPGSDKESNWLPAPKSGAFSMNLRLYWPKRTALEGWAPPPVKRVT